jgi:hypothetical protein
MKNLFSFNWIAQEEDLSLLSDLTENDTRFPGRRTVEIAKDG